MKNRVKRVLLWAGLFAILLLIVFSIYGAFIGTDKAQDIFNSLPLSIYWAAFAILVITAILLFGRLRHFGGLLLAHLGCVLVAAGGMWGSQAGFKMQDALLGTETIRTGHLVLYEGMTDNAVNVDRAAGIIKTLPFAIRLIDFRMEHYDPGELLIQTPEGIVHKAVAQPGLKYTVSEDWGSIEIVRRFERFKIIQQDDKRLMVDNPEGEPNPALELRLTRPDGTQTTRYVFERFEGHTRPDDILQFRYVRMIRDFISDLEVVKDGTVLARKSIEVNKPMHFGGFLIYQQGYDSEAGQFTVLRVVNERGLGIVFGGYALLCTGAFWHLWFRHLFSRSALRTG